MTNEGKRRHVFISHHHKDDKHVDKLTGLLHRQGDDIRNSSWRLKPENEQRLRENRVSDEVIRRYLRRKVSWAGTIVVLIGEKTHTRPWVNWEIEEANRQGKRIVGVYLRGGTEADVPESLKDHASAIVNWNTSSISNAINGENIFQASDGSVRPAQYQMKPSTC